MDLLDCEECRLSCFGGGGIFDCMRWSIGANEAGWLLNYIAERRGMSVVGRVRWSMSVDAFDGKWLDCESVKCMEDGLCDVRVVADLGYESWSHDVDVCDGSYVGEVIEIPDLGSVGWSRCVEDELCDVRVASCEGYSHDVDECDGSCLDCKDDSLRGVH